MKFDTKQLWQAVGLAAKTTERGPLPVLETTERGPLPVLETTERGPLPVLENLYLVGQGSDGLEIRSTTLEVQTTVTVAPVAPAAATDNGAVMAPVVVNARKLKTILSKLKKAHSTIELETDKDSFKIRAGSRNLTLGSSDSVQDFLASIESNLDVTAAIDGERFEAALRYVLRAVSTDETRYNMLGVCFDGADIMATDAHRGHLVTVHEGGDFPGFIVPALGAFQIADATKLTKGQVVDCSYGPRAIRFKVQSDNGKLRVSVCAKLIDAEYPALKRVIPERNDGGTVICAENAALLEALDTAQVMGPGRAGLREAEFRFNGAVDIVMQSDGASFAETVEAAIEGPAVTIGFNCPYLVDAIKGLDPDVRLQTAGAKSPLRIDSREGYVAVVMPVRLSKD